MGIYEFNCLEEHDKYDKTFTTGIFVDTVFVGDIKYVLYALSKFWVEVTYDSSNNKIIGLSSFVSGKKLNRYSNVPKEF